MQHWWFPTNASSYGQEIDNLFVLILYITGATFFIVEIALVVFLIRYRARAGRKAEYVEKFMPHIDWDQASRRYRAAAG